MKMTRGLLFASLLALAGAAQAAVSVTDAWVRGTVPGQSTTAAYMTLRSTEDAKIVSIATPVAKHAAVHASEMKDGIMHMRPAGDVPLPAGKEVPLQGSLHVMLMDVVRPLGAGDSVPLTLTIEDRKGRRSRVEVRAPVRPLGQ